MRFHYIILIFIYSICGNVLAETISFHEPPPKLPTKPLRPDLEKLIYPYNRGLFPRTENMLRLDFFYTDMSASLDDLAKWAYTEMKSYNGNFLIFFHFVFDETYSTTFHPELPNLKLIQPIPDFRGATAKLGRVTSLPAARFAYQGNVWIVPGHTVKESANALLEKLKIVK